MADAMRANDARTVEQVFETLEDISIDYALMERARHVLMARAEFDWDDVGAWPALDRSYPHDARGNVLVGDPVVVDCENCIVYNEAGHDVAVAVVGAENLVVVATNDAMLVIPKDRAQDVRHAVAELKRRNAKQV
jgi:mannose-1-phosphate guanylyltransferase